MPVMKASGAMTSARVSRCRYHYPSSARRARHAPAGSHSPPISSAKPQFRENTSALAPHHPPRPSDRDFATQVEDTLQSCTEAKRADGGCTTEALLPDTVTEQMLKTYASADTPKMGSFAERRVPVCTSHRQPYFYVFERGRNTLARDQDYQKQRTWSSRSSSSTTRRTSCSSSSCSVQHATVPKPLRGSPACRLDEATCSGNRRTAIRAILGRWQTVRAFAETESLATPMWTAQGPLR